MKSKTGLWIFLLASPVPLLLLTLFITSGARSTGESEQSIITVLAMVVGMFSVVSLLLFPLWVILLVKSLKQRPVPRDQVSYAQNTSPIEDEFSQLTPPEIPEESPDKLNGKKIAVSLLLVVIVLVALVGLGNIFVNISSNTASFPGFIDSKETTGSKTDEENNNETSSASRENKTDLSDLSEEDKKKWDLHYGLQGRLLAHAANNGSYPGASASGWNAFVAESRENSKSNDPNNELSTEDPFIDPHTNTTYKFTTQTPGYGEIQYRSPSSCVPGGSDFAKTKTANTYAFRLKYSDGIRCATNI
ncbi:MAG: hypothetical protein U5L95_04775 [Candidatus Saccharibacteria bacterium]|nr:hypothetical protein [Candidatus Saccharibacteria bacterium]